MPFPKSDAVRAVSAPSAPVRSMRALHRLQRPADDAVTPVIGSIMILGITVMGIAAVMLWGGPALQRVQEQGAQGAMLGEFQEIRRDTLVLSIADSSRVPRINLEAGTFGLREGTRTQITAIFDDANTGCDFHVTGWGAAANDQVSFTMSNCGTRALNVYRVTGTNVVPVSTGTSFADGSHTLDVGTADLTRGDWMFELASGSTPTAQAWLMSTRAVFWDLQGSSTLSLQLEGGAIFSGRDGTFFLETRPPVEEEAAGNIADFVVEWHTYSGSEETFSGRTTPSLFLGLVGNDLRLSQDKVYMLRFDFEGEYGQAWCNTLLQRNDQLTGGDYVATGSPCSTAGAARYALQYVPDPTTLADISCTAGCVQFEFIHARITTAL